MFKEKLGVTPKRFLRYLQLNHAYRDLLKVTETASSTVTEIAGHHGFTEMGRFSVEYKRLIGESPSTTLARSASTSCTSFADILLNSPPEALHNPVCSPILHAAR
ncbi:MAG: AraC family transcriptional regulator [Gammaproteobacteria bacterium]|nr:AraC family transcriptional regulator [Gammaproteobacteria bacterium]